MIKKTLPIAIIALSGLLTATISSCSKGGAKPANYLEATVNGNSFKAGNVYAHRETVGTSITVNAYLNSSEITFYMNSLDTTAPATYTLVDPATNNFPDLGASYISDTSQINNNSSGIFHFFDSGSVKITKVTYNSAKGTFNFYNTKDGTKATNGSFSFTW